MKHHLLFLLTFLLSAALSAQIGYVRIDESGPLFTKVGLDSHYLECPSAPCFDTYEIDLDKNGLLNLIIIVSQRIETSGYSSEARILLPDSTYTQTGPGVKKVSNIDTTMYFETTIAKIFNAQDTLYADSCHEISAQLTFYSKEPSGSYETSINEWASGPHFFGIKKIKNNKTYLGWVKLEVQNFSKCNMILYEYAIQSLPVGIEELPLSELNIYPNPVSNTLTINCTDCTGAELYDAFGKLLITREQPQNTSTLSMDVKHLTSGLYLIRLFGTANNTSVVKKIIKD